MGKLNIDINSFIPKHKYIRLYNSEDEYNADIEAHDMHECCYSVLNKANTETEIDYQPSHRTTNDDDKRLMTYLDKDNLNLWAGLKIIWGYFGWEEKTYNLSEDEELLGGQFYVVKPMTVLKTVPDLWQYEHLVDFLKNVDTVDTYQDQDFSTIKAASYLVNAKNIKQAIVIPASFGNLDSIEYIPEALFYLNNNNNTTSEFNVLKLNGLKSISTFPINPYNKIKNYPKIELGSCEDFTVVAWNYENYYIRLHSDEIEVIDSIKGFGNLNNIKTTPYFAYYPDRSLKNVIIDDNYMSVYADDCIATDMYAFCIYNTNNTTININRTLTFKGNVIVDTASKDVDTPSTINISNLEAEINSLLPNGDRRCTLELIATNVNINHLALTDIAGFRCRINADTINITEFSLLGNTSGYIGEVIFNSNNLTVDDDYPLVIQGNMYNVSFYNNIHVNSINFPNGTSQYGTTQLSFNDCNSEIPINLSAITDLVLIYTKQIIDCNVVWDSVVKFTEKYNSINENINVSLNAIPNLTTSEYAFNNIDGNVIARLINNTKLYSIIAAFNKVNGYIDYEASFISNENSYIYIEGDTKYDSRNKIKIFKETNRVSNIHFKLNYDYGEDETIVDNSIINLPTYVNGSLTLNSNINKDLVFYCDHISNSVIDYFSLDLTYKEGYDRRLIFKTDETKASESPYVSSKLSLKLTGFESFTLEKEAQIPIYSDIIYTVDEKLKYLDLSVIVNTQVGSPSTINFTPNKFINLKMKWFTRIINYNDMCDELDFEYVHDTVLGNVDNPHLGKNNNLDPNTANVLTINRNLYNKFTDTEKEQMVTCWKTINIREKS